MSRKQYKQYLEEAKEALCDKLFKRFGDNPTIYYLDLPMQDDSVSKAIFWGTYDDVHCAVINFTYIFCLPENEVQYKEILQVQIANALARKDAQDNMPREIMSASEYGKFQLEKHPWQEQTIEYIKELRTKSLNNIRRILNVN